METHQLSQIGIKLDQNPAFIQYMKEHPELKESDLTFDSLLDAGFWSDYLKSLGCTTISYGSLEKIGTAKQEVKP